MSRGIRVSFPVAEPVVTPRAREGLRTVVPTIFPPSTVNRGESVRIRPPDHERSPLTHATAAQDHLDFPDSPKKRGPKPKLRPIGGGPSTETLKRKADKPLSFRPSKLERLGETSNHDVIHLTQRFQGEPSSVSKQMGGRSSDFMLGGSVFKKGFDILGHGRKESSGSAMNKPPKIQQPPQNNLFRSTSPTGNELSLSFVDDNDEPWLPCLKNMEKIVVTDVTSNSLTVTIKESSTDKGFFKEKR